MKKYFVLFLLILISLDAAAQIKHEDQYMSPSKVYVGDKASLIIPLPGYTVADNIEINLNKIPVLEEIIIHSILLERRPVGSRLLIEFSAFAPGILNLPQLNIEGEIFEGLKVEISSILERDDMGMVLSDPAPPLAVPGTSLLVFGIISATIALLILGLWISIRGRKTVKIWKAALQRRQLFALSLKTERNLRKAIAKGSPLRQILDTLSAKFRSFLSFFSGKKCEAMTAQELGALVLVQNVPDMPYNDFFKDFFSRCDAIRFSGCEIYNGNAENLLDDYKNFILSMKTAAKKKRGGYGQRICG